ncbi:MAG: porin, partial [Flavipsychrobacter sp.]
MKKQIVLTTAISLLLHYSFAQSTDTLKEVIPFDGQDQTWQNGSDRRTESVLQTKYFTGSFMFDGNYNYSFNNPIDNTVVGSTAMARHNEMEIMFLGIGGDFNYKNAR